MAEGTSPLGFVNLEELKSSIVGSGAIGLLAAAGIAALSSVAANADVIFANGVISGLATFGISYVLSVLKKANQGPVK